MGEYSKSAKCRNLRDQMGGGGDITTEVTVWYQNLRSNSDNTIAKNQI